MTRLLANITRILSLICIIILACGCENKWPDNGDFDGMWQLMSIEQNGTVTSLKDTKHYWSVRTNLVQYSESPPGGKKFCHFERNDNKLILTDFCHESRNAVDTDNDEWITYSERDVLEPWGIYAETDANHPERLTQVFTIDYLDSDHLILSATSYKLEFRKF